MNKIALESLVMDLKRISMGYHRGSINMAKRFAEEAIKRKQEVNLSEVRPYIRTLLDQLDLLFKNKDTMKISEDSLMISTLLENYVRSFSN